MVPFSLNRAFQEYKNLTATLENITGITCLTATETFYIIMMNIYGHQSELIIRRGSCNYKLYLSLFLHFYNISIVFINSLSLLSQSLIYLNSVQLMSIMDHFGYTTRPLVEFNLSIYTERASFLGWLSHMSERKRLAITLDPASSEPARFKNKRIQASGDMIREESEPEVVPISPPSTSRSSSTAAKSSKSLQALNNQPTKTASRAAERKRGADSEDDYKPPTKKTKVKSKRSSSRSKAGKKPNTSAYGRVTDVGGKCPKHLFKGIGEASDSDTSQKSKRDDWEGHSDSLTDS